MSKALRIPEKRPTSLAVLRSLLALVGRKQTVVRNQFFPQKPPGFSVFDSRAQGFSTPLARQRSSYSPFLPNLVLTRSIARETVRLRALLFPLRLSAPPVPPTSRVLPPLEGHQIEAQKEVHLVDTIPNQTKPPPRLNRLAESRSQPTGCIS